jgi:beta-glucosidase
VIEGGGAVGAETDYYYIICFVGCQVSKDRRYLRYKMRTFFLLAVMLVGVAPLRAQTAVYKDATQPVERRVSDLLSRMTPEEKFFQLFMIPGEIPVGKEDQYKNGLFGFQVSAAQKKGDAGAQMLDYGVQDDAKALRDKINSIQHYFVERSRLGIPMIAFDEALHGLVRGGATVYPAAIALAATWDTALMSRVSTAIAGEARIRGIRDILSPVINIASDPRWGRVEESYGEDPLLTSAMVVSFVRNLESHGIVTTPKHFIANVGDGGKDSYPIYYNERLLDEIYFPPFIAAFKEGGSRSVMTAYNSVDGTPASQNEWLLTKKLKQDWGFKGFVISDANAVGGANVLHFTSPDIAMSEQQAVNAGMDVAFQTSYDHAKLFIPHFLDGGIDKKRIDDAVRRVLRVKFELGLFEHPYVTEEDVHQWGETSGHRAVARQAARESIVLLKNTGVLPLSPKYRSIAVIGADAADARLGGYSGPGNHKVSILDGIRERAGAGVKVTYSRGSGPMDREWMVVPRANLYTEKGGSAHGLKAEYFANLSLSGVPAVKRVDANMNFQWTLGMPDEAVGHNFYSARWTGVVRAPEEGAYRLGLEGDDGYRLWVNDSLVIDQWVKKSYHSDFVATMLQPGKEYAIRVEFNEPVGNAHLKLVWRKYTDAPSGIDSAMVAAMQADVAVVVVGIHEGEFQDRASLALPVREEDLIERVQGLGKPVVVVLVGGSAITMNNWLDKVPGVLDVWYPGEEGGHAVTDVLFGDADPGGRLPISFPISEAQLPWVYNHAPTGRGDDYYNLSGLPLFPFGYGMSYTHFSYSGLSLDKTTLSVGDSAVLSCRVTNDGERDGDEVVQLYLRETVASVARPVIALKGWKRLHLRKGESAEVRFVVGQKVLASLNKTLQWEVEPAEYQLLVGASSRDLRLKGILNVTK